MVVWRDYINRCVPCHTFNSVCGADGIFSIFYSDKKYFDNIISSWSALRSVGNVDYDK